VDGGRAMKLLLFFAECLVAGWFIVLLYLAYLAGMAGVG
jgi:hypothetical protein